jgi:hypothetical protein
MSPPRRLRVAEPAGVIPGAAGYDGRGAIGFVGGNRGRVVGRCAAARRF